MTSVQLSAKEEKVEKFLDAAARGDVDQVSRLLSHVPSLINQTGYSGWTALMLAARNGHVQVAEKLLSLGCDESSVNGSSQTAYQVARFWGHRHIAALLSRCGDAGRGLLADGDPVPPENYFSRETLDRQSRKRTDRVWLEARRGAPETTYLLFSSLSPMVTTCQEDGGQRGDTRLCRFRYEAIKDLLQKPATVLIFLGVEKARGPGCCSSFPPQTDQEPAAWFAINTDEDAAELLQRCSEKNCSFAKTPNRDLLKLSEDEAGVVAQARSVLAWHSRYGFCPTCGGQTGLEEGGYKRTCQNPGCRSLQGVHNTCYPRVDPVVIMLVVHPDGNQCLLGRKKAFPAGLFSCLAGFVEPGETVEEAVRREVEEESGVKVGPVRYVSCQPWPMPSSLMIGCIAVATSTHVQVDQDEIEEARWFPRQQVTDALRTCSSGPPSQTSACFSGPPSQTSACFSVPPSQTIAHQLIQYWLRLNSNL